ncbi:hypothetical protein G6F60_014298 [Rhizopus arrhizus]|nr:hypothetical protein G6F60_014298 [Rhizopus arrhizus]
MNCLVPRDLWRKAGAAGILLPSTPEEYGGGGGDFLHTIIVVEEIARALATDADILLMDAPAAGLSREDKTRLAGLLRRIAEAGAGVLLVEHDMALVMGVSDHIVAIDAGRELAQGNPAQIQQSPAAPPSRRKAWA